MEQQNIFMQIVEGKIPAKTVYEDDQCMAILDINPMARGHILLFPKKPYVILPQIPEGELDHLAIVCKKLSQLLLKGMRAQGTTILMHNGAAAGQRLQQFLIHIIPRREGDGILAVEEKVLDAEMKLKIVGAVKPAVVKVISGKDLEQSVSDETKQEKEVEEAGEAEQSKESKESEESEVSEESEKEGEVSEEEKSEADKKDKGGGESTSLDDIAALFK